MEVDLHRPPAPLGGRIPVWLAVTILWALTFALQFLVFYLSDQPGGALLLLILFPPILVVFLLSVYFWRVFGVSRLVISPMVVRDPINVGNPEDEPRLADREELSARRRFRKGRISRVEYERIIAHRHFVHGEITQAEYHAIMARLAEGEPRGLQW